MPYLEENTPPDFGFGCGFISGSGGRTENSSVACGSSSTGLSSASFS
jgi:hypothetical protein